MRYVKDYMLVDIDLKQHLRKTIKLGEKEVELYMDTIFSRMEEDGTDPLDPSLIPHKGTVVGKPRGLSSIVKKDDITLDEINEGDVVYFHHHVVNFERRTEDGKFFFRFFRDMIAKYATSAYCKIVGGEIIPIHKWSICKKYKNIFQSTTLIIPQYLKNKKSEDLLEMVAPSRFISDEVSKGDVIVVKPLGVVDLKIEGEDYVVIHEDDIFGVKIS